jgi:hypothetical protein
MTDRRHQDELYQPFQESDSHNEKYTNEQPSSSSDDDSEAVSNAIAISNKEMKQIRKMHRLSPSSSHRKKNKPEKVKKTKNLDILNWDNLPLHPEWLLDRERKSAEALLPKGKCRSNTTLATSGRRLHPYDYREFVHETGTDLSILVDMIICLFFQMFCCHPYWHS